VDILLRAYAHAFAPHEPVCLILKGHSGDVFYRGQHMADAIAAFQLDPQNPRLRHLDTYLSNQDLAALYRAADVAVFPYRAEGFAIPILEAMACGLPCIVPRFGACLDYCDASNAFFVEPRRIRLPVRREIVFNALGFSERVEAVDFCEVPVVDLADALRAAFEASGETRRARGDAAARAVRERWTWDCSLARMRQLLHELQFSPGRRSSRRTT
jgi:glycosyltransferase involved in cell wall biosynthesis